MGPMQGAIQIGETDLYTFALNLLITFGLSLILKILYIRFGRSLSNRRIFSENLIMIAVTTMIIITIVKSSLALSLGLVGALSIVRFRTAIKEPEELTYLFLAIAIGVGLGAGQRYIILLGFLIVSLIIGIRYFSTRSRDDTNLYLTLSGANPSETLVEQIVNVIKNRSGRASLKRLDEAKDKFEVTFHLQLDSFEELDAVKKDLRKLDDSMQVTFLDSSGVI